jgi:hypothetical protein
VLKVGSTEKTAEEKNVVLKQNAKIKVGPMELSLDKGFGGDLEVKLGHTERTLKSVVFLDKGGKEIKSEQSSTSTESNEGKTMYYTQYRLEGKATAFTVRVTYFSKVESVPLAIDATVGLGF